MATLKRKPTGAAGSTHTKYTTDARPAKKFKSENKDSDTKNDARPARQHAPSAPIVMKTQVEEPLFPRGGGSALTPLELKRIQIEAKRDAMFEAARGPDTTAKIKPVKVTKTVRTKTKKGVMATLYPADPMDVDSDRRKRGTNGQDQSRSSNSSESVTWDMVKKDAMFPARVTKITERQIYVQLSKIVSGPIDLTDLDDDFDGANPSKYAKNQRVQVSIVDVDATNKKLRLSTRPSRVPDSVSSIIDREISVVSNVRPGEVLRGFVKNVAEQGLFVALGGEVTAFVRISDLSDAFLKEWKDHFQIGQLVKGRISAVDSASKHVTMTLKASLVDQDYVPLPGLADLREGQIVTGKIRSVEEFGAFIVVDKTAFVSGLCHRSEMADKHVKDARKLYNAGDVVKARILKIDLPKKKISFGLKASYFVDDDEDEEMDSEADSDAGGVSLVDDSADEVESVDGSTDDTDRMAAHDLDIVMRDHDDAEDSEEHEIEEESSTADHSGKTGGLEAGGFDWTGDAMDEVTKTTSGEADANVDQPVKTKKKKKRNAELDEDRTAQMNADGPQTAADFERFIMSEPNSSALWTAYMAFKLQAGDPEDAREVAKRAIQTIEMEQVAEKMNIWTAYLNLECAYGTDDTVEQVFGQACQVSDEQEVHERLASIYIQSGKRNKADDLFQSMLKKFGSESPQVWTNYAHFLYTTMAAPDRARALLSRATQALDNHTHIALTTKFASLEFRTPSGSAERGRTIFEGLLATYPKKSDLWRQLLDLEIFVYKSAAKEKAEGKASTAGDKADPAPVRDVFERGSRVKGLKPRAAMEWFRRWSQWEADNGDAAGKARVMARTRQWTEDAKARKKGGADEQQH